MKVVIPFFVLAVSLVSAETDIARKQSITQYQSLLNNSPFTLPPKRELSDQRSEPESMLKDWQLSGVLPFGDSYFVTLQHKTEKDKSEYLRGLNQSSESGFELKEVVLAGDPTKTRVRIQAGNRTEWLTFDLKGLGVQAPKPAIDPVTEKQKDPKKVSSPGVNNDGNRRKDGGRKPRPRGG